MQGQFWEQFFDGNSIRGATLQKKLEKGRCLVFAIGQPPQRRRAGPTRCGADILHNGAVLSMGTES
jgi:hypothetical protein